MAEKNKKSINHFKSHKVRQHKSGTVLGLRMDEYEDENNLKKLPVPLELRWLLLLAASPFLLLAMPR